MKEKILIVDDAEFNRELLREILGEDYDIMEAENGEAALEIIKQEKEVAAILLDLVMPVMDGFEFMFALRDLKLMGKIPVLVISGEKSVQSEKKCFDYGVSDFIGRPFNAMLVRKRVQNVVNHYAYKNKLEEKVAEQTIVLRKAYNMVKTQAEKLQRVNQDMIDMLGEIVEYRNLESGEHIQRVKGYTRILAEKFSVQYPEYNLKEETIQKIINTSALHDVGKISILDSILLKPG
ncbi:MAG: response regulator [Agathobacter sp.]|nr:response regulator [Agathobacter sp.]